MFVGILPAEVRMPPGKVGKFVELPVELVAELQRFCERQGTTFTFELAEAIRRHLAYPPKREPEPLPDAEEKPAKKGKK
jgi:hypothetical protein